MIPMLFRGEQGQSSREANASDSWFVTYGIQESYDAIVKESEEWRAKAEAERSSGRFSRFTRKKPAFVVDQETPPRLYRLRDDRVGNISFELTEVEGGGTSIKAVYDSRARPIVQDFRAKMPVKVTERTQRVCPTCGKQIMPDFKTCPFCGTKL